MIRLKRIFLDQNNHINDIFVVENLIEQEIEQTISVYNSVASVLKRAIDFIIFGKFLICNYKNDVYDSYLTNLRPYLPIFVIHFIVYMLGRSYHYRFPIDDYKAIFS